MAFLVGTATRTPDAPAMEAGTRKWSYEELVQEAQGVARRLRSLGVAGEERVAILGGAGPEMVLALHAVWLAGGVVSVLPPRATRDELARALSLLQPRVVLLVGADRTLLSLLPAGPQELRSFGSPRGAGLPALEEVHPDSGALLDADASDAGTGKPFGSQAGYTFPGGSSPGQRVSREPSLSLERPAAVLLTSGTTGAPKSVTLTLRNLVASARAVTDRLNLRQSDRWLASLSPAHVGGLALITRAALVGSCLVVEGSFGLATFLGLLRAGAFTHASLVPTMLAGILDAWGEVTAPDALRCLLIGGAPASEALVRRGLSLGFPLALTYGLTEATSQVATADPELAFRKPGSVGPPLPGIRIRIDGKGEILVRGPTVAVEHAGEGGWLRTGDTGDLDPEGHLRIVGRLSDRIISGGENVDPREVESFLTSQPGVREAAVVGVPDAEWGERVVAVVVREAARAPTEAELVASTRLSLSPAKRPKDFRFVDEIPLNPNGKVDRVEVRRLFE